MNPLPKEEFDAPDEQREPRDDHVSIDSAEADHEKDDADARDAVQRWVPSEGHREVEDDAERADEDDKRVDRASGPAEHGDGVEKLREELRLTAAMSSCPAA